MKYFVLKHMEENGPRLTSPDFAIGSRSSLLITKDHSALLFESADSAVSYLELHNLEGFEPRFFDLINGELLAILAGMDLCKNALIDGKEPILFLSCYTGAYVLPGHFYRHTDRGYEVVQDDDRWHPVSMDLSSPSCSCGGLLGAWIPSHVEEALLDKDFGIQQVIASNCMRLDEEGCNSLIRIDLEPPQENWNLDVVLSADGYEEVYSYDLSHEGFVSGEGEYEEFIPWDICPVTGLISLAIPYIDSNGGLDSFVLRGSNDHKSVETKIDKIASVHAGEVNADAGTQLEQLKVQESVL